MSAEIIEFAAAKSGKRVFVFHEACPVCAIMVKPFVVAGRATNRFRCDGTGSYMEVHEPYHWKSGDHDVEMGPVKPGYDIPPAIERTVAISVPDVS
ncbi:hypothetical protein [Rhizobium sp. MHM7A]|uniref:hypothetical protein n=1 Tax=Rhizobium sp. MHM7A TaxID=2583233 RepID=UPI0011073E1A|nr:hypothetical protein [Rhizobium sp. MHM7A]TLX16627.1 hypothetical protein FFR93_04605 [Rhizobium sp. MHM7A]